MKIQPPFAIDLGTTRTAAAIFLPGAAEPEIAETEAGEFSIPSVVLPLTDEPWKVGDAARQDPKNPPVESVKRRMGRRTPERDEIPNTLPEEISAAILKAAHQHLKHHLNTGEPSLNFEPVEAVITIPAYFDAPQIEATRRAAEIAGLRLSALIQEPTAAAIYHCWKNDLGDGTYLVYDLGGGTFDVSIIRALYGDYQILSIDGDNHLGGDDFDRRLASLLRQKLSDRGYALRQSLETEADQQAFDALTIIARQIKEELSYSSSIALQRPANFRDLEGQPVELDFIVRREEFEESIEDLLDATLIACRRALHDLRLASESAPPSIDGIFLVGGSTLIPAVPRKLLQEFGPLFDLSDKEVLRDDPMTSVALGAALCAAALSPVRFSTEQFTLLIDELPGHDDPYLAGRVEYHDQASPPDELLFQISNREFSAPLEKRDGELFFALQNFPEDIQNFELRLTDQTRLGPFPLWLPHQPLGARQPPRLALTNPAVLAKDISLEIVDQGQSANLILLPRGSHLPAKTTVELATSDDSGALILQLFQHYLPIHTMVLSLPEGTRQGTKVELILNVDQTMRFTASGSCAGQIFQVQIDRPEPPSHLDWEAIETILNRADSIEQSLWGGEKRRFQEEVNNLRAGIRSATYQDPDRLQVLARRLEATLNDFAPKPGRSPGLKRITTLIDRIRQIVFAAEEERLGKTRQEWRIELDKLTDEAHAAWRADDDHRWRTLADRVQALFETSTQDEYFYRRRDPNQHAQDLLDINFNRITYLKQRLSDFPLASDKARQALQREELNQIQRDLASLEHQFELLKQTPIIPSLQQWSRSITRQEERLHKVHLLGLPQKNGGSK